MGAVQGRGMAGWPGRIGAGYGGASARSGRAQYDVFSVLPPVILWTGHIRQDPKTSSVTRDEFGVAQNPRRGPALLLVGLRQLLSPATPCEALLKTAKLCYALPSIAGP